MFVHSVYFWLRPDLTAAEHQRFVDGVESLRAIDAVRHCWIGVPAPTARPVVDRSYSYALTVVLEDLNGHDRYQDDPIHDRFRKEYADLWTRVVIYDSVEAA